MSVKFEALGLSFPTLYFGFCDMSGFADELRRGTGSTWKSFFFSAFFLALDPILAAAYDNDLEARNGRGQAGAL